MNGVGYLGAFAGGLLALLSPCSAMLLPSFFAYSFTTPTRLVARTAVFYLGLATTLVPLGVAGSFASRLFYGHRGLLVTAGGWTLIALGAAQILGLGFGSRLAQRAAGRLRPFSAVSVYLLGMVYGLAGFCAGPILGSILTVAALSGHPFTGGALLAVYALGMAVPLFVLAVLWNRFSLGSRRWLRGRELRLGRLRLHTGTLISGAFFMGLGVMFLLFDGASALPSPISTGRQYALERHLEDITGALPTTTVALAVAGVALIVFAVRLLRPARRESVHGDGDAPGSNRDTAGNRHIGR